MAWVHMAGYEATAYDTVWASSSIVLKSHLQPAVLLASKLFSLYILLSGNGTSMSGNLTLVAKSFVISFAFSFSFTIFL